MPNIDADAQNPYWLRNSESARDFSEWTHEQIVAECEPSYEAYAETLPGAAPTLAELAAVSSPRGVSGASVVGSTLLPPELWHDAWWAAKSSQTLALTLLAAGLPFTTDALLAAVR